MCCTSDCTALPNQQVKRCRSYAGGRCETNADCWSCQIEAKCRVPVPGGTRAICTNGVCSCPDECCKSSDCPPGENCLRDENGHNGECKPQVIG